MKLAKCLGISRVTCHSTLQARVPHMLDIGVTASPQVYVCTLLFGTSDPSKCWRFMCNGQERQIDRTSLREKPFLLIRSAACINRLPDYPGCMASYIYVRHKGCRSQKIFVRNIPWVYPIARPRWMMMVQLPSDSYRFTGTHRHISFSDTS